MDMIFLFLNKKLNLNQIVGISDGVSSMFSRVGRYSNFILMNAENDTLHKYVIQNGRRMFRGISEIVGLSILVPRQNLFNDFL